MSELERYDVYLLTKNERDPWSMTFRAESFAHAEEQAKNALGDLHQPENYKSEIIKITRDY